MSEADDAPDPKFSRETRIRVALAKYHGLDGQEWSKEKIADYLNVRTNTVTKYLNDTEMAKETEHSLVEKEAQTRLQLIEQFQEKLDRLDELEQKIQKESEAVPTQFRLKQNVMGEVDFDDLPNVKSPEDGSAQVEMDVPVPDRYEEMPNIDKLEKIWREKRLVEEQIEDLLGLESPDELDVNEEKVVDVKYWKTSGELPEQEVIDVSPSPAEGDLPEPEE